MAAAIYDDRLEVTSSGRLHFGLTLEAGREWVVLPDSTDEMLMLRPVGGLDEEIAGVLPAVEPVESATFPHPALGRATQ